MQVANHTLGHRDADGVLPSPHRMPDRGPVAPRPALARMQRAALGRVLRTVESVLFFEGGQRTARRNAWDAVCADRRRARARAEASDVLRALGPVAAVPGTAEPGISHGTAH